MKKENLAFLVGGLAFGVLFGFGLANALVTQPGHDHEHEAAEIPQPAGPPAPGGAMGGPAAGGGAPMMAEIQRLQGVVAANPNDAQAWTRLANLYHDAGMYPQAVGFYEKADQLAPGNPNIITDLGVCLRGSGQPEKALAAFERAQKADPGHWQSVFNQVIVLGLDLGRFAEAEAALARLERLNAPAEPVAQLKRSLEQARAGGGAPAGS
jgi:hypothetical protein